MSILSNDFGDLGIAGVTLLIADHPVHNHKYMLLAVNEMHMRTTLSFPPKTMITENRTVAAEVFKILRGQ